MIIWVSLQTTWTEVVGVLRGNWEQSGRLCSLSAYHWRGAVAACVTGSFANQSGCSSMKHGGAVHVYSIKGQKSTGLIEWLPQLLTAFLSAKYTDTCLCGSFSALLSVISILHLLTDWSNFSSSLKRLISEPQHGDIKLYKWRFVVSFLVDLNIQRPNTDTISLSFAAKTGSRRTSWWHPQGGKGGVK